MSENGHDVPGVIAIHPYGKAAHVHILSHVPLKKWSYACVHFLHHALTAFPFLSMPETLFDKCLGHRDFLPEILIAQSLPVCLFQLRIWYWLKA